MLQIIFREDLVSDGDEKLARLRQGGKKGAAATRRMQLTD
jgi:hypothetical protein